MSLFPREFSSQYLDRIRKDSCYATPRKIIGIMFWLSIATVLLASGVLSFSFSGNFVSFTGVLSSLVSLAVSLLGLVLARAAALAFFDIADVLIEANRRKNDDG